jgi:hypothetical protein
MYYRSDKKRFLDKLIKQDCLFFDSNTNANDHFTKNKLAGNSENPKNKQETNTSRELKEVDNQKTLSGKLEGASDGAEKGKLKLKENIIDNDDTLNANMTNEGALQNNENVNIHNNFVDQLTTSRELNNETQIKQNNDNTKKTDTIKDAITMRDYESLPHKERFIYDNRSLTTYIFDDLVRNNLIVSIIFKHSIADPDFLKVGKLFFLINLIFGTNALFFNESYIEQRAISDNQVNYF